MHIIVTLGYCICPIPADFTVFIPQLYDQVLLPTVEPGIKNLILHQAKENKVFKLGTVA